MNTATKVFQIKGIVIDKNSRGGLAGLTVQAWDKDMIGKDDMLGSNTTDNLGNFIINFGRDDFEERFFISFDRNPDIYFKVYDKGILMTPKIDVIRWNNPDEIIPVIIEVEGYVQNNSDAVLKIESFAEFLATETEIINRISRFQNGGLLFMTHPFLLLHDINVVLSDKVKEEILDRLPELSVLSPSSYNAIKNSDTEQHIHIQLRGLFPG